MSLRFLAIFCVFISLSLEVFASDFPTEQQIEQVAQLKPWQHLLHYHTHPFTLRYQSQNDSPKFFLSPEGKTSLQAELYADLQAFLATEQADNASAQCRFPARYVWLKTQFPQLSFVDQPCSELTQWQQTLAARWITVVFPSSHINSPSSMYGHTFIRLDRADENSNKLLAYSVNFAANADPEDNELVFSYKGLTGGYPGVVSVLPYFAKTNEYSHMEARDIWEYRLNLSQEEVDQFVRHVWETKDVYFDYYFFDENCSYRLLALLDAASARVDAADDFYFTAMPVDTVRALQQRGLVEQVRYRPSSASDMESKSAQARAQVLQAAKNIIDSEEDIAELLRELNPQEQAQALELAYAYARYLAVKKKQDSPRLRERTIKVLSARAKISESAHFAATPEPNVRDDQGHLSRRMSLSAGRSDGLSFIEAQHRIAFHDVMDLPQGFAQGAQIQMGKVGLRGWENGALRLQEFQVVDVLSLSHDTYFQRPIAWAVSGGFERFIGENAELYGYIKVAFGKAKNTEVGRFYALAETQLLADDQFNHNAQLSLGPRLGWLWQGEKIQTQLEGNWQGLTLLDSTERREAKAMLGYALSTNAQLQFAAKHQAFAARNTHEQNELGLALNWSF